MGHRQCARGPESLTSSLEMSGTRGPRRRPRPHLHLLLYVSVIKMMKRSLKLLKDDILLL